LVGTTFDKIWVAEAVATWRQSKNNLLIPYGLACDTALSSYVVATTPTVAAKIGQPRISVTILMLEIQAVGVRTDCGMLLFTPVASVLGAN